MIYFLRESISVSVGGWVSIPTCIAQFHSVYTRAACPFRLVKVNNKWDVVAGARGVGGVWVGGGGARGVGGGGGVGVVERRGLREKGHGSYTKQEL